MCSKSVTEVQQKCDGCAAEERLLCSYSVTDVVEMAGDTGCRWCSVHCTGARPRAHVTGEEGQARTPDGSCDVLQTIQC